MAYSYSGFKFLQSQDQPSEITLKLAKQGESIQLLVNEIEQTEDAKWYIGNKDAVYLFVFLAKEKALYRITVQQNKYVIHRVNATFGTLYPELLSTATELAVFLKKTTIEDEFVKLQEYQQQAAQKKQKVIVKIENQDFTEWLEEARKAFFENGEKIQKEEKIRKLNVNIYPWFFQCMEGLLTKVKSSEDLASAIRCIFAPSSNKPTYLKAEIDYVIENLQFIVLKHLINEYREVVDEKDAFNFCIGLLFEIVKKHINSNALLIPITDQNNSLAVIDHFYYEPLREVFGVEEIQSHHFRGLDEQGHELLIKLINLHEADLDDVLEIINQEMKAFVDLFFNVNRSERHQYVLSYFDLILTMEHDSEDHGYSIEECEERKLTLETGVANVWFDNRMLFESEKIEFIINNKYMVKNIFILSDLIFKNRFSINPFVLLLHFESFFKGKDEKLKILNSVSKEHRLEFAIKYMSDCAPFKIIEEIVKGAMDQEKKIYFAIYFKEALNFQQIVQMLDLFSQEERDIFAPKILEKVKTV
jgi:hypothetical protein